MHKDAHNMLLSGKSDKAPCKQFKQLESTRTRLQCRVHSQWSWGFMVFFPTDLNFLIFLQQISITCVATLNIFKAGRIYTNHANKSQINV